MNFEVKRADGEDKDFQDLMKLLDEDLWKRYSDLQKNYAGLNATNKSFLVVIGYEEEKAVSCGALKQIDESTLELKRVFTKEEFRGKGYSRKVLYELESWSKEKKMKRIVLETGVKQPEAIAFYTKEGFVR